MVYLTQRPTLLEQFRFLEALEGVQDRMHVTGGMVLRHKEANTAVIKPTAVRV